LFPLPTAERIVPSGFTRTTVPLLFSAK